MGGLMTVYVRVGGGVSVPIRSEWMISRAREIFTPGYNHSERDIWLAQRFVHWLRVLANHRINAGLVSDG